MPGLRRGRASPPHRRRPRRRSSSPSWTSTCPSHRPLSRRPERVGACGQRRWTTSPTANVRDPSAVSSTRRPDASTSRATPSTALPSDEADPHLAAEGRAALPVGEREALRTHAGHVGDLFPAGEDAFQRTQGRRDQRGAADRDPGHAELGQRRARARSPSAPAAGRRSRWTLIAHADHDGRARSGVSTRSARTPQTLRPEQQHVVRPLEVGGQVGLLPDPVGDREPGQQRQPGPPVERRRPGRTSTDIAMLVPGGAVQVRPSRPRPADWWSATSTLPAGAPVAGGLGQVGVGGPGLVDHVDPGPQAVGVDQLRDEGRSLDRVGGTGGAGVRHVPNPRRAAGLGFPAVSLDVDPAQTRRAGHPHDRRQAGRPGQPASTRPCTPARRPRWRSSTPRAS